nr:integrase core domain-containing protein [Streptomyces sp. NRRL S-1813]
MVTGIDDHSRFVVIASVVAVPSARAVRSAFIAAMRRYGVPFEVLTDNGKQFTGRHTRPQPVEVLFERICRENGITQRLTKPRSPTTTGKIERFHRTLREEFLDQVVPFESLAAAQEAIDGWGHAYNHQRPHQALKWPRPSASSGPTPLSAAMMSILNRQSPNRSCPSRSSNRPSCRRRAPRSSSRCGCLPAARSPW